jgi:hypothetical protein
MFKDVLNHMGSFTHYAEVGLVIFFVVFVGVAVRVVMTPKETARGWAELPLGDEETR